MDHNQLYSSPGQEDWVRIPLHRLRPYPPPLVLVLVFAHHSHYHRLHNKVIHGVSQHQHQSGLHVPVLVRVLVHCDESFPVYSDRTILERVLQSSCYISFCLPPFFDSSLL